MNIMTSFVIPKITYFDLNDPPPLAGTTRDIIQTDANVLQVHLPERKPGEQEPDTGQSPDQALSSMRSLFYIQEPQWGPSPDWLQGHGIYQDQQWAKQVLRHDYDNEQRQVQRLVAEQLQRTGGHNGRDQSHEGRVLQKNQLQSVLIQ